MLNHDKLFARQAAEILQIPPMTIARWGQIFTPAIPGDGKGNRSLYSFQNLVEIQIAEKLSKFGVPLKKIQTAILSLRTSKHVWLDENKKAVWMILDHQWRWSLGTTMEIAFLALPKREESQLFIVVNVGVIKQTIFDHYHVS